MKSKVLEPIKFTEEDCVKAASWNFNCGPGALCSVFGLKPEELRPYLGEFEKLGYTSPTMMVSTLNKLGAQFKKTYRADNPSVGIPNRLESALVRIQWSGPWTDDGVHISARQRHTHWVAVRNNSAEVFDVNAVKYGGWLPIETWSRHLVPWLISKVEPESYGKWWSTHVLTVQ